MYCVHLARNSYKTGHHIVKDQGVLSETVPEAPAVSAT
jgi:hypothetical protein